MAEIKNTLVSVDDAAEYLSLSPNTVRSWISQKRLPIVRLGRRVFLKRHDLDEIIENGYQPARTL